MRAKRLITLAVVGLALMQTGCATNVAPQVAAIGDQFEELDLGSLGDVACDLSYQPGLFDQTGNEFRRQVSLADETLVPQVVQTLEDQGFVVSSQGQGRSGDVTVFEGPNEMTAGVSNVRAEFEGEVRPFYGSQNCIVPPGGLTVVSLILPK